MAVIADYLTVSTPVHYGAELRASLEDVALQLDDAHTDPLGVRLGTFGLLSFRDRISVAVASTSGVLLAGLRDAALLGDYCSAIAAVGPHRVTTLHAALDVPTDAPAELHRVYGLLRVSGVQLTRKRIPPENITTIFSRGEDGRDTGSIMIGHRGRAETTAIIYDRRHDARSKGKPDPGPLLRYELRTGVEGLSLRDVVEPTSIFHHFMGSLVPRPPDVPAWVGYGEGYNLERRALDLHERLDRLIARSNDVGRILDLADLLPGDGFEVAVRLIRQRRKVRATTRQFAASASAARRQADDSGTLDG